MDESGSTRTAAGARAPATPPGVDPFEDTGPQPAVIGPFPADHHTHAMHGHPHVAPPEPLFREVPAKHAAPRRVGRGAVIGSLVVALLALGGVAAFAMSRTGTPVPAAAASTGPAPAGSSTPGGSDAFGAPSASATPMLPPSQSTLVLGDSLALTVYPWLADLVPDRYVSYEAEVGRSTASTARALRDMGSVPPVVIVSAGTNDATAADVEASAVDILDELGPERCVVWVDVVRPDSIGDPSAELNAAIGRAAEGRANVRILRWSEAVATNPQWVSGDGIHPTEEGAKARAAAFAAASTGCSPADPDAPRAKRQYLPTSAFYGPLQGQDQLGSGSGTSSARPTRTPSPSSTRSGSATPTTSSPPSASPSTAPSSDTPPPAPTPTPEPTTPEPPTSAPPTPTSGSGESVSPAAVTPPA